MTFFESVYRLVAQIPEGRVMTYGQIADLLGRASARYVGYAMRAAPADRRLPCHRVLNRKGEMAPGLAFGGADIQRAALEAEGVGFDQKGRVNLEQCLWRPGPEVFADALGDAW